MNGGTDMRRKKILVILLAIATIGLLSIHYLSAISFLFAVFFYCMGEMIADSAYDARTREGNRIWNMEMKLISVICIFACISVMVIRFTGQDPVFVIRNFLTKCQ